MVKSGKITLREIASRAGTSPMAVSVVLNGARSNTRVSDTTRSRIMAIASDLNYSPNAMAQSLKRQRTNTLGVLFNWAGTHTVHNLFSMAVLDGIVAGAAVSGFHILLYTEKWHDAATSAASFSDRRTDGIVVVSPNTDSDVVPALVSMEVPITLLSSAPGAKGVPFVKTDNRLGVTLALDHLWELGHKRIAYVGSEPSRYSIRERQEAYCAWMAQHELSIQTGDLIEDIDLENKAGRFAQLEEWLRRPLLPTAIFAVTDDMAADILEVAQSLGISVPEQLSVVGFDDVLVASLTVPRLTTIHQPLFEMGQKAAQLLIESIEGKGEGVASSASHIAVPQLIVRASTAPPLMPPRIPSYT